MKTIYFQTLIIALFFLSSCKKELTPQLLTANNTNNISAVQTQPGGVLLAVSNPGKLYSFNAQNGKINWVIDDKFIGVPAVKDSIAYLKSAKGTGGEVFLNAISIATGTVK